MREWTSAGVEGEFDLVITSGGGYPLDKILYHTGKGMCSALPILRNGGTVLIASACSDCLGSPSFGAIMDKWGEDWRGYLGAKRCCTASGVFRCTQKYYNAPVGRSG